jgi:V8-like Glu-specific endopeptidase
MQIFPQLTLALAFVCATSAFAQDALSSVPKASASPRVVTDSDIKTLQQYWTPERLANAKPMPIPKVDRASVSPAVAPTAAEPIHVFAGGLPAVQVESSPASLERFPLNQGSPAAQETATAIPDAFTYEMPFNNFRTGNTNAYPYATIGKLFFIVPPGATEAPGEYVCTASVAMNKHTVVTARHCMFDFATQKWYSGWVFYPGWNDGADAVLGGAWYPEFAWTWTSATTLSLTTGWDIGFLAMHDNTGTGCNGNKGHTIGYFTGWLGYSYGGDYTQRQWNIFGYPQEAPFEGNYRYQDNGATGAVNPLGSTNVVEVGNPQTGGCSGGPWIIGFDPGNATVPTPNNNTNPGLVNLVNGVNSFEWTNPAEPLAINGTVFTTGNFYNLYLGYSSQVCD